MKKVLALVLATFMLFAIVACGQQSGSGGAGGSDEIVIAMIPQQLGNVVFLPTKEGMEDKGAELGITVEWAAPVRAEATEQVGVVESLIERGISGLIISCVNPDALQPVLERAMEAGIVVATFDADSPNSGRAFYAGTDNYQAGFICGQEMIKLYADSGLDVVRVAQLEGLPGAFDMEERKQGFADAIAGTNIELVYSGPCDDDVDKAIEVIEAYTRAHGESFDAWFMAGGWPYLVNPDATPEVNSWKAGDPNRKVVTMDIFDSSVAFFERELIDVAVGQDFYAMGALSVQSVYDIINGREINAKDDPVFGKVIDTGVRIVYLSNWREQLLD